MKFTIFLALAIFASLTFASDALAQSKPAVPAAATTLPSHWEEIDQRFVYFTVQLASVETSLDAVNKALKVAGYHQLTKQQQAALHQKGNDLMDRNGGGPVRWDQFYGRTAEEFYHASDFAVGVATADSPKRSIALAAASMDPKERPPQFDFIYRANENAQQRAEEEVAKLGGQIDALVARRRQLEVEQAASWSEIAFQGVASRKLGSKPIFRFDLKIDGTDDLSKQRQDAVRAAAAFVRVTLRAAADAQNVIETNPTGTFDALNHVVSDAAMDFNDKLLHCPRLALDAGDPATSLGRVVASTERLADVTRNISDSYHRALEGDQSGDEQQKQTFRAYTQQALFDCSTNVFATAQYVMALGEEWKAEIDVEKPISTTQPTAVAAVVKSDERPPVADSSAAASTPIKPVIVKVQAKSEQWTELLHVKKGQRLSITATGRWSIKGPPNPMICGPDGMDHPDYKPGNGPKIGTLVGRIGDTNYTLGSKAIVEAPDDGLLEARIFDTPGNYFDNDGEVTVHIESAVNGSTDNKSAVEKSTDESPSIARTDGGPVQVGNLKLPSGPCTITTKGGLFLAISGGSRNAGDVAILWSATNDTDQQWLIDPIDGGCVRIANKNSGLYLGMRQDRKDPGGDAIQWNWAGGGQRWTVEPRADGFVDFINTNSGLCLTVHGNQSDRGAGLMQEKWRGTDNQLWKIRSTAAGAEK